MNSVLSLHAVQESSPTQHEQQPTCVARNVCITRSGAALLQDVSISLISGTFTAIVGPNGAGKSTLLNVLAGDIKPDRGYVRLGGDAMQSLSPAQLALRRALVASPPSLAFDYTTKDVLTMGWLGTTAPTNGAFVTALRTVVAECELEQLIDRPYNQLSSGEKQRVEYGRAILQLSFNEHTHKARNAEALHTEAKLLLLDEPTANLDVRHALSLLTSVSSRCATGLTAVAVVHDLDLAARFADNVLLLKAGRAVAVGTTAEVMTSTNLSHVYQTPIHVEWHETLQRRVVIG